MPPSRRNTEFSSSGVSHPLFQFSSVNLCLGDSRVVVGAPHPLQSAFRVEVVEKKHELQVRHGTVPTSAVRLRRSAVSRVK